MLLLLSSLKNLTVDNWRNYTPFIIFLFFLLVVITNSLIVDNPNDTDTYSGKNITAVLTVIAAVVIIFCIFKTDYILLLEGPRRNLYYTYATVAIMALLGFASFVQLFINNDAIAGTSITVGSIGIIVTIILGLIKLFVPGQLDDIIKNVLEPWGTI